MGFAATVATNYANKWIAVHSTDSLFKSIVSAVTLAGTLAQLNPTGTLTVTAPTDGGRPPGRRRQGRAPGHAAIGRHRRHHAVRGHHRTPPCRSSSPGPATQGTQHVTDTGTFTNWGKPLHLTRPDRRRGLLLGPDEVATAAIAVVGLSRPRPPAAGRRGPAGAR